MTNLRLRSRRTATAAAAVGAVGAAAALCVPAAVATAAAPAACGVLTRSIAARLLEEQPRTVVSTRLICQYGRASERDSTKKSTVSLTIVPNASVSAAKATQRRVEKIVGAKRPPGTTGFAHGTVAVPDGEATWVYYRLVGAPIVGGFVFLRIGAYTA